MVPSPPERSGTLSISIPYNTKLGEAIDVDAVTPALPDTFSIKIVVNGVSGPEKHYPEDNDSTVWEDGNKTIDWSQHPSDRSFIEFSPRAEFAITSFDCYIDGVKMSLIH